MFDCNGVLIHDEHVHQEAFSQLVPGGLTDEQYAALCHGKTDEQGIEELLAQGFLEGNAESLLAEKTRWYDTLTRSMPVPELFHPSTRRMLTSLGRENIPLFLVTASSDEWLSTMNEKTGVSEFFPPEHVATSMTGERRAQHVIDVAKRYPPRTLVVDDSLRNLRRLADEPTIERVLVADTDNGETRTIPHPSQVLGLVGLVG